MSTEPVTPPTGGIPVSTDDYNAQNILIENFLFQYNIKTLHLTNWDSLAQPEIAIGVALNHGGVLYIVKTSNQIITGTPTTGRIYIKAELSGGLLVYSFVNSAAGFAWNYTQRGFYNGAGDQLLPYVIIYSSVSNIWYKYDLKNSENPYNIEGKILVDFNIPLGFWNMETTLLRYINYPAPFVIAYPQTPASVSSYIIDMRAWIINDDENLVLDAIVTPLGSGAFFLSFAGGTGSGQITILASGQFNDPDYNRADFNRGDLHLTCRL